VVLANSRPCNGLGSIQRAPQPRTPARLVAPPHPRADPGLDAALRQLGGSNEASPDGDPHWLVVTVNGFSALGWPSTTPSWGATARRLPGWGPEGLVLEAEVGGAGRRFCELSPAAFLPLPWIWVPYRALEFELR